MSDDRIDYRFTLANERTYLAWMRTAVALVAGGLVIAKALEFEHEVWRWVVAVPPIVAGAVVALGATRRRDRYESAMRAGDPLPVDRFVRIGGVVTAVYALLALLATLLD